MLFNSEIFLFAFLPTVLCVWYLSGYFSFDRFRTVFLVGASLFFYGWWSPDLVLLLVLSVLGNYGAGIAIDRVRSTERANFLLVTGVAGNLAILAGFKYFGFFARIINDLGVAQLPIPEIILPLAISFFTFQQIAYLVDVYAAQPAEKNIVTYSLFVTFFPQLIAGPIVHHREMIPQYATTSARPPDFTLIGAGLTIFALGLFKKIWLADTAAYTASSVFDGVAAGRAISFFEAWAGSIAYSFQIYFDFSGYSDMAIGLGLMFGLRLPVNFLSPYKATSIIDFWRCWHMTLSRFLRDYLYIPLGGSRKGIPRRYINLMLTMLLGGLWHGAAWTFVIWGGLHGLYLIVNHCWRWTISMCRTAKGTASQLHSSPPPPATPVFTPSRIVAGLITFLAVTVAWVFFRADDLTVAIKILQAMSGFGEISLPLISRPYFMDAAQVLEKAGIAFAGIGPNGLIRNPLEAFPGLLVMAFVIWCTPCVTELFGLDRPRPVDQAHTGAVTKIRWQASRGWGLMTGVLLAFCFLGLWRQSEFIYFNF